MAKGFIVGPTQVGYGRAAFKTTFIANSAILFYFSALPIENSRLLEWIKEKKGKKRSSVYIPLGYLCSVLKCSEHVKWPWSACLETRILLQLKNYCQSKMKTINTNKHFVLYSFLFINCFILFQSFKMKTKLISSYVIKESMLFIIQNSGLSRVFFYRL